jgi:hypothetical protein
MFFSNTTLPGITIMQGAGIGLIFQILSIKQLVLVVREDNAEVSISSGIVYDIFLPILFYYAALCVKYIELAFK